MREGSYRQRNDSASAKRALCVARAGSISAAEKDVSIQLPHASEDAQCASRALRLLLIS